ncbi:hypothetical protein FVR03_02610 [Pontibacter qinzhouensis]|uniref:Uncharacterized protein n=1 Tax=Pontibacter qinzhouensis TaxID=2603253 RepID=A0A5C8KC23_9BACT|nr:hypothetical protein [Pontibacter qinzhouensis]TXK51991.1 hypothetical protein FVR03_02610 [Pontibacter qinzhouensis]
MNYAEKLNRYVMPVLLLLLVSALASPLASARLNTPATVTCNLEACHERLATCSKPAAKSQQRSVLDAEALESPITYFKDMMASDADNDDDKATAAPAAPLLIAVKGLVATLLSTII